MQTNNAIFIKFVNRKYKPNPIIRERSPLEEKENNMPESKKIDVR